MKVIIAGGRDFGQRVTEAGGMDLKWHRKCVTQLYDALRSLFQNEHIMVVSGGAIGADQMGEMWAEEWFRPIKQFPADWDRYGRSAGYRRNEDMAKYADVLVAFWDGHSRGTKHMIDLALLHGLEVHIYKYEQADVTLS